MSGKLIHGNTGQAKQLLLTAEYVSSALGYVLSGMHVYLQNKGHLHELLYLAVSDEKARLKVCC